MADALASTPALSPHVSPIELVQQALSANQVLQHELTKRAEELESEIKEADRLLEALENGSTSEDAEHEIRIPGARKAASLFTQSECLSADSPFHDEAIKRCNYAAQITAQSFNLNQLESLRNAVLLENQRLQAYCDQSGNHGVIDIEGNVEGIDWSIVAEKVSDASSDRFTADQCRIKWIGNKHPSINHSEWKMPEIHRLQVLVEDAKKGSSDSIHWDEIAEQLGTQRSILDVMNRQARPRHQWDSAADRKLLKALDKYGLNNWMSVAREVGEYVTPTQCQNRYRKSLDPTMKRGAWTTVEDERLKKAVEAYGCSWIRVAEFVPGRTNDQCNERWTSQLNANSSRNLWLEEEDKLLLELESSMGRQWKAISEKIGNGKTGPSCRLRFNRAMKVKRSTPASCSGQIHHSPVPATASFGSSQSPVTMAGTVSEESTPIAVSSISTDRSRGKKRARQTDLEQEDQSVPKKKRTRNRDAMSDVLQHDNRTPMFIPAPSRVPRPRPVAEQNSKPTTVIQAIASSTSTPQEPASHLLQGTSLESAPVETAHDSRRRSARFASRTGGGDANS